MSNGISRNGRLPRPQTMPLCLFTALFTALHNVDPNPLLNSDFTYDEVQNAIVKVKNNKNCGTDQILNEYLKNTTSDCIKLYTKLFNVILNTGIVPEKWVIGVVVKPIYKGKGSKTDPDNYRGITILSCIGKLFTSILEKLSSDFLDHFKINGPEQAGLKSGFSAENHNVCFKNINVFIFVR